MRGEIELPPDRGEGGVIPRIRTPLSDMARWTTFSVDVASSRAMIGHYFKPPTQERDVSLKRTNTFLVQVWDEQVIVYLNGELLFTDYDFEDIAPLPSKGQVGLGARHGEQFEFPTLYRNVQIRRLTRRPTPQRTE